MPTNSELMPYIGREYNENTKAEIEEKFEPYEILVCDLHYFYVLNFLFNTIRCVVKNGKISNLAFN
jgi:hypothetical protein